MQEKKDIVADKSLATRLYLFAFSGTSASSRIIDIIMLSNTFLSVLMIIFDSVARYHDRYSHVIFAAEWYFTIVFTLEFILKIYALPNIRKYLLSFNGFVDFISAIPKFLALFISGYNYVLILRSLRLLRILRLLKIFQYIQNTELLTRTLRVSRNRIFVFLSWVLILTVILGTAMYVVEGAENGFENIPKSIYWAVVTITTVGYGDITPNTNLGQVIASAIMLIGYSIIAIPTGLISAEYVKQSHSVSKKGCKTCAAKGHDKLARYCFRCGSSLEPDPHSS